MGEDDFLLLNGWSEDALPGFMAVRCTDSASPSDQQLDFFALLV